MSEAERTQAKQERRKKVATLKIGKYNVTVTLQHAYSGNKQWRVRFADGVYEKQKRRRWKIVSDAERHTIPKAVIRDLEQALDARHLTDAVIGGFHSSTPSSENSTPGSQSITPQIKEGYKPAWCRG